MLGQECGFYLTDKGREKYEKNPYCLFGGPSTRKVCKLLYPDNCLNIPEIAERLKITMDDVTKITKKCLQARYLERDEKAAYPALQAGDSVSEIDFLKECKGFGIAFIQYSTDLKKPLRLYHGILKSCTNESFDPSKKIRILRFKLTDITEYKPAQNYRPGYFSFVNSDIGYIKNGEGDVIIPFSEDISSVDTFCEFKTFKAFIRRLYKKPKNVKYTREVERSRDNLETFLTMTERLFKLKPLIRQL